MKRSTSLRQPLVLYALFFSAAVAAVVLTLSAVSLVQASRRAYRRAVQAQTERLARLPPAALHRVMQERGPDEVALRESTRARTAEDQVSFPLRTGGYLVAEFDRTVPTSIAFVEVNRIVPLVFVGTLALAWAFAFMTGRLLLGPLGSLAEVAEQSEPAEGPFGVDSEENPNEIMDIARRFRRTIARLQEERARLAEQKDELERVQEGMIRTSKLASVGRLAAGIAHEVGNPLAAVRGYLALLESGLEPEEQHEVVERSQRELARIHDTIRKLLAFARSGESADAPPGETAVSAVIEAALDLARGHPALRDVQVEWTPRAVPLVKAHPERLGQVFMNLLLNAAQATGPGGRIRVECEQTEGSVQVQVDDDGPGVPTDARAHIFDPFFTTKAPGEGTGLGLAVSRAMVEAMGGELTVTDAPAGGARFVVRLKPWELASRPGPA